MHFPAYAGGKFISNCLALSKNCMIMDKDSVGYLTEHSLDYEYRLQKIISILPNKNQNMKNWVALYEFGDSAMYGHSFAEWQQGNDGEPNDETMFLANSSFRFTMTAHSLGSVDAMLKFWKDATVISLVNYRKFQSIAWKKKGTGNIKNANECVEKYNILKGISWPSWEEFEKVGYNVTNMDKRYSPNILSEIEQYYPSVSNYAFDVDSCIFDKNKLLSNIRQLYQYLKFDDYNDELVSTYWEKYIALHI